MHLNTHKETINVTKITGRQTLKDEWEQHFEGFNTGFWIGLNSKKYVVELSDYRTPTKVDSLDGEVGKYIKQLNEFCFGRKYLREADAKLKCLVGYEVGGTGMVHAHIIAAHRGNTDRTVQEVEKFSNRKWSNFYKFDGSKQFVFVEELKNPGDRIWYITKQSVAYQRRFAEFNLVPY